MLTYTYTYGEESVNKNEEYGNWFFHLSVKLHSLLKSFSLEC